MKSILRPLAGLALAVIAVSCGGGGASSSSSFVPKAPQNGPAPVGSVQLQLKIPPKSATTGRAPAYVSPATQSVSVAIDGGAPTVQNLSPSSPNCSNAGAAYPLLCTVTLSASAGAHTVTINTFDQLNAAGNSLSVNSISVTFVAGQSPTVPVVLAGVPASIAVYPGGSPGAGTMLSMPSNSLYFLAGQSALPVLVEALDADGNPIVGPGSPTLQVSVTGASSGSGIAVNAVSGANPNAFALSSSSPGTANLAIVATPAAALAGTALSLTEHLSATVLVSTFAGSGTRGFVDGGGSAALFNQPEGIAYDPSNGDFYVTDSVNDAVRQITSAGVVTTIAGGVPPTRRTGFVDGAGSTARFQYPTGIVYDPVDGNLYVTDTGNCAIRQVSPISPYTVTTVAGKSPPSRICGNFNAVGTAARFRPSLGITVNPTTGTLYVADSVNGEIRAVTVPGYSVSTLAGSHKGNSGSTSSSGSSGSSGSSSGSSSRGVRSGKTYKDGNGTAASFAYPIGITFDPTNGNLYVADTDDCAIRQVSTASPFAVSTLVGTSPTLCGFADGGATTAEFNNPRGIVYDPDNGDLYVTDTFNGAIRQVSLSGSVVTVANAVANTRSFGLLNGFGPFARFNNPTTPVYDSANKSLFVADRFTNTIRQIEL